MTIALTQQRGRKEDRRRKTEDERPKQVIVETAGSLQETEK
jgi:hypothetical protein